MYFQVHPLRELITQGEGLTLDFKKTISSARKIAKTLSAFANTKGGRLLIGVNDNGKVTGTRTGDELYMIQSAANVFCDPKVPFEWTEHEYKGKLVLEIYIPESQQKPHLAKDKEGRWWAYHRVDDETLTASIVMLNLMRREMNGIPTQFTYSEPEQQLLQYIQNHGAINIKQATKELKIKRKKVIAMLVDLLAVGVLNVYTSSSKEVYDLNPIHEAQVVSAIR